MELPYIADIYDTGFIKDIYNSYYIKNICNIQNDPLELSDILEVNIWFDGDMCNISDGSETLTVNSVNTISKLSSFFKFRADTLFDMIIQTSDNIMVCRFPIYGRRVIFIMARLYKNCFKKYIFCNIIVLIFKLYYRNHIYYFVTFLIP